MQLSFRRIRRRIPTFYRKSSTFRGYRFRRNSPYCNRSGVCWVYPFRHSSTFSRQPNYYALSSRRGLRHATLSLFRQKRFSLPRSVVCIPRRMRFPLRFKRSGNENQPRSGKENSFGQGKRRNVFHFQSRKTVQSKTQTRRRKSRFRLPIQNRIYKNPPIGRLFCVSTSPGFLFNKRRQRPAPLRNICRSHSRTLFLRHNRTSSSGTDWYSRETVACVYRAVRHLHRRTSEAVVFILRNKGSEFVHDSNDIILSVLDVTVKKLRLTNFASRRNLSWKFSLLDETFRFYFCF